MMVSDPADLKECLKNELFFQEKRKIARKEAIPGEAAKNVFSTKKSYMLIQKTCVSFQNLTVPGEGPTLRKNLTYE